MFRSVVSPRLIEHHGFFRSAKKSGKIGVTVTHFARTIPALAEIHTGKTLPLPCVSTVFMAKTVPLIANFLEMQQQNGVIYIYNWWDEHFNSLFDCTRSTVRRCLCLVCSTAFVAKTLPCPCVFHCLRG